MLSKCLSFRNSDYQNFVLNPKGVYEYTIFNNSQYTFEMVKPNTKKPVELYPNTEYNFKVKRYLGDDIYVTIP